MPADQTVDNSQDGGGSYVPDPQPEPPAPNVDGLIHISKRVNLQQPLGPNEAAIKVRAPNTRDSVFRISRSLSSVPYS